MTQSALPEPMSSTAILSFQDAVEHFLLLAVEHLQVNVPTQISFVEYWTKLQPGLPAGSQLPGKLAMDRANKLRVALKHYGTFPSARAIDQARGDVSSFFTDACPMIFGARFEDIDMIDLVSRVETVKLLEDADTHAVLADYPTAMAGLALALADLIQFHAELPKIKYPGRRPFRFGPNLAKFRLTRAAYHDKQAQQVAKLTEVTQQLREAMQVLALGIDYARYARFKVLTPHIEQFADGSIKFFLTEGDKSLNADDYQFGRLFVIESALRAVHAEGVLQRRDAHLAANRAANHAPGEHLWTGPAATT
ncbi:hypothetical protein ACIOD1_33180 [Streptomyces sp. NPDC088097]|uniref:hypothetical protein n=1 Tax=Streptomyces sp. NPDC088097 TaxID=3365823 RepID=UPI00380A0D2E